MPRSVPKPRPLITPAGRLASAFAGLAVRLLGALSPRARGRLAAIVGRLAYTLGIRRRVTLDNLRHAFPELPEARRREIARGAYVNMALAALEGLSSQTLSGEALERAVEVEQWPLVEQALAAGKGMLVATAHFGSWELLGEVVAKRGLTLNAVVRPLAGALNARLMESRQKSGLKLIPGRGSISASVKALARNEVVAMLVDQVLPEKQGVFVPFFGRLACTSPALSLAALRSGAPVFVAMAARDGDRLRVFLEGPLPVTRTGDRRRDVAEHTRRVTEVLERYIRHYPEQWLWLHRRWKVQPTGHSWADAGGLDAHPEPDAEVE